MVDSIYWLTPGWCVNAYAHSEKPTEAAHFLIIFTTRICSNYSPAHVEVGFTTHNGMVSRNELKQSNYRKWKKKYNKIGENNLMENIFIIIIVLIFSWLSS